MSDAQRPAETDQGTGTVSENSRVAARVSLSVRALEAGILSTRRAIEELAPGGIGAVPLSAVSLMLVGTPHGVRKGLLVVRDWLEARRGAGSEDSRLPLYGQHRILTELIDQTQRAIDEADALQVTMPSLENLHSFVLRNEASNFNLGTVLASARISELAMRRWVSSIESIAEEALRDNLTQKKASGRRPTGLIGLIGSFMIVRRLHQFWMAQVIPVQSLLALMRPHDAAEDREWRSIMQSIEGGIGRIDEALARLV